MTGTHKLYRGSRHLLFPVIIGVAVYILLPQIGDFRSSWKLLSHPHPGLTLLATLLTLGAFIAGTGTYVMLSLGRLKYGRTLLVQLASTFVNRLLPAGIGALGISYLYLRHERYNAGRAGSIVAINNALGFIGHCLLVGCAVLVFDGHGAIPTHVHLSMSTLWKIGAVVAVLLLLAAYLGKGRLAILLKGVRVQTRAYRRRPWWLAGALLTSMALTLCNVSCLYFCLRALDLYPPFASVLLVFTFGLGAGSVVPTPGGLGGFEAGLTAGFVAYGVAAAPALAAALLYRLISYWLPMILGGVAFAVCERLGLFRSRSAAKSQSG